MIFRSTRERVLQTILFEVGGLLVVAPLHSLVFGHAPEDSFTLVIAIAVAVLFCSPLHNWAFDRIEWQLTGRVASDRGQGLRMVHAVSHEVTITLVSLPVILWMTGLSFWEALVMDLWFGLAYTIWAWVFFLIWDRVRPLSAEGQP